MPVLLVWALIVLLITFPLRWLVVYCASVRGRSPLAWSLLTYVLGPFALVVAVLPSAPGAQQPSHPAWYSLAVECFQSLGVSLGLCMLAVGLYAAGVGLDGARPVSLAPASTPTAPPAVAPCPASDTTPACVAWRKIEALRNRVN